MNPNNAYRTPGQSFPIRQSRPEWDKGARIRQAFEDPSYREGTTIATDYSRFRQQRKAEDRRRAMVEVTAGAKLLLIGVAIGLAIVVFAAVQKGF